MRTATISRLSKFGFQVDGVDEWYNVSKYEKSISISAFSKGDKVEFEQNDKGYVTKLNKLQSANPNVQSAPTASNTAGTQAPASVGFDKALNTAQQNDKEMRITRLSVLSTAFGILGLLKSEDDAIADTLQRAEVLAERLYRYATTGSFDAPKAEEGTK